ncbi:MAG: homospermidine synthase, partial [Hyphomicrobiales bacterium]|nr:homospermidine synthase [Hyphomicrobiales bacterium]
MSDAKAGDKSGHPFHGEITGAIVMIGFGSIGRGTLPLIERHFKFDRSRFVVVGPDDSDRALLDSRGLAFEKVAITRDNYRDVLAPLLSGPGRSFCVNLSVDTSSLDILRFCREIGALYVDTVVEPWPGFYFDRSLGPEARTNYALRETVLEERRRNPGGTTAVSCCGANPGMVSWFVKRAMLNLAADMGTGHAEPTTKEGWAKLGADLGVKGVHVAERDTQRAKRPKPRDTFVNTWSVEGFLSEGMQPAELGWGTHEKWMPENAGTHATGCGAAIFLRQPGANTRVRSWTPTARAQFGFLVTHNESISIADYFTLRENGKVVYRPTCHYAYHPCDDAVLSLQEFAGNGWRFPPRQRLLRDEIDSGFDELGVLLMGHKKGAYWYGSQLGIEETRRLCPHNNATSLQVNAPYVAAIVWARQHPTAGIVEPDELDYQAL